MGDAAKTWSVRHPLRVSEKAPSDVVPDTAKRRLVYLIWHHLHPDL